jgi:hypothetical protein
VDVVVVVQLDDKINEAELFSIDSL